MYFYIIPGILLCYLIGSIPTAFWYGKAFYGIDVRKYGSGNSGATNSFRVMGKLPGVIVMIIDAYKGWLSVQLATLLWKMQVIPGEELLTFQLVFAVCAVLGHVFPVFARFHGGKGIATLLGMIIAINIKAAIICLSVFFLVLTFSKYVSLSSVMATLSFPIMVVLLPQFRAGGPPIIVLSFLIAFIVVLTHKRNIYRIVQGEERKVKFGNGKNN
jgi:glycerol-3-phosphate acyltransferase PlsY